MHGIKPLLRTWGACESRIVGARQGWKCNGCGEILPAMHHLDHVVPLWKGGSNNIENNAQVLCGSCHTTKSLHEERERQDQLWAARHAAIQAARAAPETADSKPKRVRKPRPTDIDFVDPLLDQNNPFLKFVFVPETYKRMRIS